MNIKYRFTNKNNYAIIVLSGKEVELKFNRYATQKEMERVAKNYIEDMEV